MITNPQLKLLFLNGKDFEVLRRAAGRYIEYLQAHVDLLGGNGFITGELSRIRAIYEEMTEQQNVKK